MKLSLTHNRYQKLYLIYKQLYCVHFLIFIFVGKTNNTATHVKANNEALEGPYHCLKNLNIV